MRVLIIGGTRFVGYHLCLQLLEAGHEVTLFNRGKQKVNFPEPVERIFGDRNDFQLVKTLLEGQSFDAIFDTSGRKQEQTAAFSELYRDKIAHFVYISSAGVYTTGETWPLTEASPINPESRHRGKGETDEYLLGDPAFRATSIRPVYIYGPQNYNEVEDWFFDRAVRGRPILVPGDGQTITQLGHAQDLARACIAVLGNEKAVGQIYNVSGTEYVTFTGLAQACVKVCQSTVELVYFDPKKYSDLGRSFFPLRQQHFFSSMAKAERDLDWTPQFSLQTGLADSLTAYCHHGRQDRVVDFTQDDTILQALEGT
ncbi:NAD-dependent epimerase/dehydratase family protein [Anthocerotibacter panamensis]|uniref:NAD-dependent epimerase/dehydratase family protein n=1 Tax=Anthocerotibacter panamensis TaxID=2857077 RepID=UPI001C407E2D|nr:NAD-dependent epimerase/dehydratase family protein [Anthocerotibacter panamensis]